MNPSSFLIFGHRGSPKRFPENTLRSFEEALRAGADGFETDLRLLEDQTPILFHDDELENSAAIETLRFDELNARGLAIERVTALAQFAGRAKMVLEVKRSRWEETLIALVRDWPGIVVASFDHSLIRELHRRKVSFDLGITTFGYIVGAADYAARLGCKWCFPNFRFVDEELVTSMHERGIKVVPWTANRESDWQRLFALGCDGVITDFPGEAVEWRDSKLKIEN